MLIPTIVSGLVALSLFIYAYQLNEKGTPQGDALRCTSFIFSVLVFMIFLFLVPHEVTGKGYVLLDSADIWHNQGKIYVKIGKVDITINDLVTERAYARGERLVLCIYRGTNGIGVTLGDTYKVVLIGTLPEDVQEKLLTEGKEKVQE
jgi:hypothetical protein